MVIKPTEKWNPFGKRMGAMGIVEINDISMG
ncbi:hypothetical protein PPOP_3932, partial [Paenibacillus popilliae ATCC 14706]